MKKAEIVILSLSIIALVLNILVIPGGGVLTVFTLLTLSLIYYFLSFALFNNIRLRHIFKKDSYTGISWLRIAGAIGAGFALAQTTMGIMFKIQLYPGAELLLGTGLLGLLIVTIIGLIKYAGNKSEFYPGIFRRIAIIGGVGLILMLIPMTRWVEFKYRNHPENIEAMKKLMSDTENENIREW